MRRSLFILLLAIMAVACETDSDIVLSYRQRCVLTAFVYPDSDVVVNLYGSVSYSDTAKFSVVDDASVSLFVNDTVEYAGHISGGRTSVRFVGARVRPGDKVDVVAVTPSDRLEAHSEMLYPVSIDFASADVSSQADSVLNLSVVMLDPAETADYYQIVCYRRLLSLDGSERMSRLKCTFNDYLFYVGGPAMSNSEVLSNEGVFTDMLLNGRRRTLKFEASLADVYADADEASRIFVDIYLYRHTVDYYDYLRTSLVAQSYVLLPVFGLSSVFSNVDGGVGIVSCMSFSKSSVEIIK